MKKKTAIPILLCAVCLVTLLRCQKTESDKELKSAKEKLCQSNVLVLTGPAGVGKTRLALEVCKELSEETGMAVLCVKNNGVEIYDDLIAAIEPDRE